jgi:hypothetical protein
MRQKNMVMDFSGPRNKNDYADKVSSSFQARSHKYRNIRESPHYWRPYPNNEYMKM